MKYSLLAILLLGSAALSAQNDYPPPLPPGSVRGDSVRGFSLPDSFPKYPGGEVAMYRFLQRNIIYPDMERENDIEGRVVVSFDVDTDGTLGHFAVVRRVSPGIDHEAIRVAEKMPPFIPGSVNGRKMKTQFMLPIRFRLSGSYGMVDNPKPTEEEEHGCSLFRIGQYQDAAHFFRRALAADSTNKYAILNLGQCLYELGDESGARAVWEPLARAGNNDAQMRISHYLKKE